MTRSSRTRRANARAKKRIANNSAINLDTRATDSGLPKLTPVDKRYLIGFSVLALIITAVYWWMGGRNLLVFPAVLCISVGLRKFWARPTQRFVDSSR